MTSTPSNATPTNPVTWFEIHTADPERAKAFYGGVFGWTFDDAVPGYTFIQQGDGAPIGGGIAATGGETPNDAVFNIQVADVAEALAAVKEHGGSIVVEADKTPTGVTFGYAANPDGSVFGLWTPPGL